MPNKSTKIPNKILDLCELCHNPEPHYKPSIVNQKLLRVGKGPARHQIESFVCSRCVQLQISSKTPTKNPQEAP